MSCARIHPTAIIDPAARLATDVTVGPYAVIDGPVELGPGCIVQAHTRLIGPVTLGARNVVHTGAVLGDRPQHTRFDGQTTGVVAGTDNVFREHVTVHSGMADGGTRIGDRNYFMASSHVAHDCSIGDTCILANGALLAGHCTVGDGAFLSGCVLIHQYTRIGRLALLSGGATATQDIPPFMIHEGRNRIVAVNVIGLRRAGLNTAQIDAIRQAYRLMSQPGVMLPMAVEQIHRQLGQVDVVAELVTFIRASKRGVASATSYGAAA